MERVEDALLGGTVRAIGVGEERDVDTARNGPEVLRQSDRLNRISVSSRMT